jgi:CheY-like chemotaxis protein
VTVLEAPRDHERQQTHPPQPQLGERAPRFAERGEPPGGPSAPSGDASAPTGAIRVVVADDEQVVREAIADLVRFEPGLDLVGEGADAPATIELARSLQPDVVLVDVRMPGGGGLRVARELSALACPPRIVAWSAYDDIASARQLLDAGASAYLGKGAPSQELLDAIRGVGQRP